MATETKNTPTKSKTVDSKSKIAIANTVKPQKRTNTVSHMQLEEYQNKENENPQKDTNVATTKDIGREPGIYSLGEDVLYAKVNVRLEPEGQSRDTEEESERGLTTSKEILLNPNKIISEPAKIYGYARIGNEIEFQSTYSPPEVISNNQLNKLNNPEDLYAAINKVPLSEKDKKLPVPDEVWDVADVKKTLDKVTIMSCLALNLVPIIFKMYLTSVYTLPF